MAIVQQVTCDVCGKVKGAVNHWWAVYAFDSFEVLPLEKKRTRDVEPEHVCGQECATKALSEWMQKATQ